MLIKTKSQNEWMIVFIITTPPVKNIQEYTHVVS